MPKKSQSQSKKCTEICGPLVENHNLCFLARIKHLPCVYCWERERERKREREREREREKERETVVVATQPISLVVGFTFGLAPHIAYWRERGGERKRERESYKRVYVLAKKRGALNPCQKAETIILHARRVLNPRQKAAPPHLHLFERFCPTVAKDFTSVWLITYVKYLPLSFKTWGYVSV